MMGRHVLLVATAAALVLTVATVSARERTFNAPVDRVWIVTMSTLQSLGWGVDKEDRGVGWIVTDSRFIEGEQYGVYAKGTKHRLRILIKARDSGRTEVTVERRLWKEERILFVDKEEDIQTTDRTVENGLLDAIGKAL